MQQLVTNPASQSIDGLVNIPADKSITHRALILSAISNNKVYLRNWLQSTDCVATLKALQNMGVVSSVFGADLLITGVGKYGLVPVQAPLNLQNSGTGFRLLAGLLSAMPFASTLIGDSSLSMRPQDRIIIPLSMMGAKVTGVQGKYPPLKIEPVTRLRSISYKMPMASAQVKSAILLAGLYAPGNTKVVEKYLSRDHTERMLEYFSANSHRSFDYSIPGDMSSAAFFIAAAAILPGSKLYLPNVGINPTRTGIIDILKMMGAFIQFSNYKEQNNEPVADIYVEYRPLRGINVPSTVVPRTIDEFPILFIVAANISGVTKFSGLQELRFKESDRLQAMAVGLKNIGVKFSYTADCIEIVGGKIGSGRVDALGDHRIAMSFAIAAAIASGKILIDNCHNIGTSFPNFVRLAQSIGLNIELGSCSLGAGS